MSSVVRRTLFTQNFVILFFFLQRCEIKCLWCAFIFKFVLSTESWWNLPHFSQSWVKFMLVISVPFCINIVWFVRMDVTWRQNALICLLSYNLSFMHHYWQQLITHVETNLPLALGGQSAALLWFSNHYEPRRQRELWTSHFFRFLCRQYTSTKLKCLISTNYSLFYLS